MKSRTHSADSRFAKAGFVFQFTFAGECLVNVKLSEETGYVIVEITQKNIPTDEKSKVNIRLGCDSGWSFYPINLKAFYEHGVDL